MRDGCDHARAYDEGHRNCLRCGDKLAEPCADPKPNRLERFVAVREATAAGFEVQGIAPNDRRWVRALAPDGTKVVLFREGSHCWHSFWWDVEATGSGQGPLEAMSGCIGDVIGSDPELRRYERNLLRAPGCYRTKCAALYRESSNIFNARKTACT